VYEVNVDYVTRAMDTFGMAKRIGEPVPILLTRFRKRAGLSMDGLAHAVGYSYASALQRYESPDYAKEYFPLEFVERIAPALVGKGEPPIQEGEVYMALAGVQRAKYTSFQETETHATLERSTTPQAIPALPDVPVHGIAAAGQGGNFTFNGDIVDYLPRPAGIARRLRVFAIRTVGTSMVPWRQPGDPIYLDDSRPARPGDYVVVECKGTKGEPGDAFLKRLVSETDARVRLEQFNPPDNKIDIPRAQIKMIYRVIDWPELLGI